MADPDVIADEEIILRRIPPGNYWQAPGPRIASTNFELRPHETGVSVSRNRFTSPEKLLSLAPAARIGEDWRVAQAVVRDVRAMGFDVIPDPISDDTGHALLISAKSLLTEHSARKRLAKAFRLLPEIDATDIPTT